MQESWIVNADLHFSAATGRVPASAWQAPLEDLALHRSHFSIGGVSVEVVSPRYDDVILDLNLMPFRRAPRLTDISIEVKPVPDIAHTSGRQLFDSGCTWRLYEAEGGFQFDFYVPWFGIHPYKRLIVDRHFCVATLQMNDASFQAGARTLSPLTYPLDELLISHRLTQENAIELHGTGIVRPNGEANLFIGHSGAGKSTTTRLWTAVEDVEVLSDDRIIVRRDEEQIPRSARNDNTRQDRNDNTRQDRNDNTRQDRNDNTRQGRNDNTRQDRNDNTRQGRNDTAKCRMRMYGTPWHGEARYASPNSAALTRIFVLEHGHGNVITPLSPSQAVGELFARSFVPFHRHEYVESALVFLEELAHAVPIYRYAFEPDQRAVEQIRHFHD